MLLSVGQLCINHSTILLEINAFIIVYPNKVYRLCSEAALGKREVVAE